MEYDSEWIRQTHEEEYLKEGRDPKITTISSETIDEKRYDELKQKNNPVTNPSHYMFFDMEVIDVIRASLTDEEFNGYLKGNSLKYRLRCGKKDDAMQDLGKANQYEKMFKEK